MSYSRLEAIKFITPGGIGTLVVYADDTITLQVPKVRDVLQRIINPSPEKGLFDMRVECIKHTQ
jgi:hypothetical protein